MGNGTHRTVMLRALIALLLLVVPLADSVSQSLEQREQEVEAAHPGWKSLVRTAGFQQWLRVQADPVRALARSEEPADAIRLLDLYKAGTTPRVGQSPASEPPRIAPAHRPAPESGPRLQAPDVYARNEDTTVTILVSEPRQAQGSGVVIGEIYSDRFGTPGMLPVVVTNTHVVGLATEVKVRFRGRTTDGFVLYKDAEVDLAIVALRPAEGLRRAALAAATRNRVGDPVFAIGSPRGLESSLSSGIISAMRRNGHVVEIQTTAPISPGSSGGGLFNDRGQLIGITTSKARGGENINFAIDTEAAFDIRESVRIANLFTLVFPDRDLARLKPAMVRGDVVRWLWRGTDPASGLQNYLVLSEIIDRMSERGKAKLPPLGSDIRKLSDIATRIETEIANHPRFTRQEITGETVYVCSMRGRSPDPFDMEFTLRSTDQTVTLNDGKWRYSEQSDVVTWTDDRDGMNRITFDRSTGSVMIRSIVQSRLFAAGEVAYRGTCTLQ
jgi:S1-C subfamily serine protease